MAIEQLTWARDWGTRSWNWPWHEAHRRGFVFSDSNIANLKPGATVVKVPPINRSLLESIAVVVSGVTCNVLAKHLKQLS